MSVFLCENRKNSLAAGEYAPKLPSPPAAGSFDPRSSVVPPPLPNPGCATACVLFRQNCYAKMSVFLEMNLNIRGGWGLCPQTPLTSGGWGLRPLRLLVVPPHIAKSWMRHRTYLISFAPRPKSWAGYATGYSRDTVFKETPNRRLVYRLRVSAWQPGVWSFIPGQVTLKTLKIVFAAFTPGARHKRKCKGFCECVVRHV